MGAHPRALCPHYGPYYRAARTPIIGAHWGAYERAYWSAYNIADASIVGTNRTTNKHAVRTAHMSSQPLRRP